MRYASVCDGISAVSVAWHGLGWSCAWVSEIDKFCNALIEQRWGHTNLGDMLAITEADIEKHGRFDLLVGGTPCQPFSVAGLRGGLNDSRGNLALRFCQLAGIARPRWVVWENVPGVLSSGAGEDFGSIIRGLEELGYGVAWRSLDAQYFGLAQRRERVFAVGYLGDWRPAAAVLLEPEGMRGDSAPGREAGAGVAGCVTSGIGGGRGGVDDNDARAGHVVSCPEVSPALKRRDFKGPSSDGDGDGDGAPLIAHSLTKRYDSSEDGCGRGTPLVPVAASLTRGSHPNSNAAGRRREDDTNLVSVPIPFDTTQITSKGNYSNPKPGAPCHPLVPVAFNYDQSEKTRSMGEREEQSPTLRAGGGVAVAFAQNQRNELRTMDTAGALQSQPGMKQQTYLAVAFAQNQEGEIRTGEIVSTLGTTANASARTTAKAMVGAAVRRLTPRECERLQGFPDDYTLIQYRGKPAADGPRYAALGNSMAVPVMAWIGQRINFMDRHLRERTK